MTWMLLDLMRQVRERLRPRYGGTGNEHAWAQGTIFDGWNATGGTLAVGTLVRYAGEGNYVEKTTTANEQTVLGVVVGYLDGTGGLVEAGAPDGGPAAVLVAGVCRVLIAADVGRGDYAYAHSTDGQAQAAATVEEGCFGQFIEAATGGYTALVRLFGTGGALGTPAVAFTTVADDPIWAAAGDLAVADGADSADILGIGSNGYWLTVDTAQALKMKWAALPVVIGVAATNETGPVTTGTAKVTFRMPCAMTLTEVRASLSTAQASGSVLTVDINEAGTTVLSTKLTIDNTEKTSTTATPAVISDSALADDAEITIDVDQIGNGTAKGLKVWLIGTRA